MNITASFIQQLFDNPQFDILLQSRINRLVQLNPQYQHHALSTPNKLSQQLAQETEQQKSYEPKIALLSLIEDIGSTLMETIKLTVDEECNSLLASYSSILTEITQLKSKFQDIQLSISQISLKKQTSLHQNDYDNSFCEEMNQLKMQRDLSQIQDKLSQMSFMNNSITQPDLYKINQEDINLKIKNSVQHEIQMTQKQLQKKLQQMNKTMQSLFQLIHVLESSIQSSTVAQNKKQNMNNVKSKEDNIVDKKTLSSLFSLK